MADIIPFKALRPQPQYAQKCASRPYDVMNRKEAKKEAQGNPYTFLHITRSEIDLPDNVDVHAPEVYEKARDNLKAYISRDVLFKENKECYYIYQLVMNGRTQTGLVALSSIDDYEKNIIKKHEHTRPEKEQDRIQHILTTGAQTGNVFLAYRDVPELTQQIEDWKAYRSPVYSFTAEDGVQHSIWAINDTVTIANITRLFQTAVPATYIADGHHRAASAAKVRQSLPDDGNNLTGYFLTTLFPAGQLHIMDYNRVLKDLNGLSVDEFLNMLKADFEIDNAPGKNWQPQQIHQFGLYIGGQWYVLTAKPHTYSDNPIEVLDVSILQTHVLDKVLNIKDPRTDTRIDFVGGIRGIEELQQRVDSGDMQAAFSLYPVSIEQLFNIADSGEVMPPKSTWFEPKLRDGLLTHTIYNAG
jgi:uncharacterized protein (DUF1015 family)